MNFPKVLIIGQIFDNYTGGGITLKNLFRKWPSENIAIISGMKNEDWSVCGLQYLIGNDETIKPWPFSLLQEHSPSTIIRKGDKSILESDNTYKTNITKNKTLTIKQILLSHIRRILCFAGISLFFKKTKLSNKLSEFIEEFQPELIYTQLSSLELISFVGKIHEKYKIPIAIHIMDDWPVMINKTGLLGIYWNKRSNLAFCKLINISSVQLSISDEMSSAYKQRYGKNWIAFHNPIDKSFINANNTEVSALTYNSNRILYMGRIGNANEESIFFIIHTIIDLALQNKNIEFVIYTQDYMNKRLTKLAYNKSIKILHDVPHKIVPSILRSAGALILPLDFRKSSQKFARYSMPTKATEYMASGVPVLVFAPSENAVTKYARAEDWGYVVDQEDKDLLQKGIVELLNNQELRIRLVKNAKRTVMKNHDAEKVREKFREALSLNNNAI